jgi:hypothetical protein
VNRHLLAWAVVCALGVPSLWASPPPGDYIAPDEPLAGPSWEPGGCDVGGCALGDCDFSGPGIWGRTNPDFAGFPTFSFAADWVVLQRSSPVSQPILFDGVFNPLLNASDLGQSSRSGARLNFTFQDPCGWDVMFDMLLMDDFQSRQTVDPSGGVTLFFYQGIALDPVDSVFYRSDLDTGELNLRRRLNPWLAVLGGIRYLELQEQLVFGEASVPNAGYFSQTDNRLWGAQLGVEGVTPARGYVRLFATGKYGIYNNRYEVSAQAVNGAGAPLSLIVRDSMTAYVGELNTGIEIQTVPCCTIRFGYQVLWITNAALSVDQLNQFDIFSGTGTVRKGSPVYHGGFAGLVFTF